MRAKQAVVPYDIRHLDTKVAHELNKNINDKIPIEQQIVWEIDEIDEHISIYGESEDLLESKKKLEKQLEELSNEKSHS